MIELIRQSDVGDILLKALDGDRLTFEDGARLFQSNDFHAIGWAADQIRRQKHGVNTYYIANRHINYTDICKNRCQFCAFSRSEGEPGAYVLTVDEIIEKSRDLWAELRFSELHIVGGLHPTLPFSYYIEMLSALKSEFPAVHLQAFTAVEIAHLADIAKLSVSGCLSELRDAGLGSLPGGGAEVFAERVRESVCPEKMSGAEWLKVMREAHKLGVRSNATMLYGHIETPEEKVDHLLRLRELQDETNGFLCFIPLRFHPENTRLAYLARPTSGIEDLKTISISRLMLDNFPHIKVFWIMLGVKTAQVALSYGADDFDGTVVEEKITHRAGAATPQGLAVSDIRRLIEEAGLKPIERDTLYQEVKRAGSRLPAVS
ncbi:MAG: aminofutalosine synthase MqnE [Armatimonadota bacterium]|nr:aminofutalosine synthase MqnE [Armatimonadota bacterium]